MDWFTNKLHRYFSSRNYRRKFLPRQISDASLARFKTIENLKPHLVKKNSTVVINNKTHVYIFDTAKQLKKNCKEIKLKF